ncbi:hypothetical protein ACOL28_03650 [Aliarcobacter butzleri]
MEKIYVAPVFMQEHTDEIIFSHPDFIEINVKNKSKYKEWILDLDNEVIYNAKLAYCLSSRKKEYDLLNQDELRFDDQVNGTTTWIDSITAIKEKYPKPERE